MAAGQGLSSEKCRLGGAGPEGTAGLLRAQIVTD